MSSIYDLDFKSVEDLVTKWGEPGYRAKQIWDGLYRQFWDKPVDFSNLPQRLKKELQLYNFIPLQPIKQLHTSDNSTIKVLFSLEDGLLIESVLMKNDDAINSIDDMENTPQGRYTVCVSTQAGCAMNCSFCATGQMGFKRNLSSGEILSQVLFFSRQLKIKGKNITNIVFMGMGEPFINYDNTLTAINQLNDPGGFNMGERRFTVSTIGILPALRRFTEEKRQINLAVSLHAADDRLRNQLVPINRTYPVDELLQACREYSDKTGRRVTFEWALIKGVNDSPVQAELLANKIKGTLSHVNLIPLNPTNGFIYSGSESQVVNRFKYVLGINGIICTVRKRRGLIIRAGCGQLADNFI